jgi:hypothetical protein
MLSRNCFKRRVELSHAVQEAPCIFEPGSQSVHGDFTSAQLSSAGMWPQNSRQSGKGPYGSTGLHGKSVFSNASKRKSSCRASAGNCTFFQPACEIDAVLNGVDTTSMLLPFDPTRLSFPGKSCNCVSSVGRRL